jgi:type III secretion protein U
VSGDSGGEKTEKPTPKKIRDARNKGQVAHSKDFTQTLLMVILFGYIFLSAGYQNQQFIELITLPSTFIHLPFAEVWDKILGGFIKKMIQILLPYVAIVIVVGILGEMLQIGVLFATENLSKLKFDKLNPVNNAKNLFSKKSLVEFLKSVLKVVFLGLLVALFVRDALPQMMMIPLYGVNAVDDVLSEAIKKLLLVVLLFYTVVSVFDLFWQRHAHEKELMMTKDEVKREYKESEGDPHIKSHRKDIHREMLEEGNVGQAAKSSVVVSNPTHVAVAIYYHHDETPLPMVMAIGRDDIALRMMEVAREAGVPVIQNITLARALLAKARVRDYVPSDLLESVADVLITVQQLKLQEKET